MAKTVQHIGFNCRDKAAQERFYTEHFGFRRVRVLNAGQPDEFVMLRLGQLCMELFQAAAGGPEERAGEQKIGFKHLAFEVPDLAAKVAELKADGIETGPVVDCADLVLGLSVCFFDDPEGNVIELMAGWSDQADPPPA
ncbi:MAG: VOC family protein [Planctomycetota bacterium]|jgi:glyoxylase I family protein